MASPHRSTTGGSPRIRVAVGSDQTLVAESVVAALSQRAYDAQMVRWPRSAAPPSVQGRRIGASPPDVGLLVSDLVRMEQVRAAQTLVAGLPVPWLAMAGRTPGPTWGGLYDRGVKLVVPSDTGLDTICRLLDSLAAGKEPPITQGTQRELIRGWREFAAERNELAARLRTLSLREDEVLQQLHGGLAVRDIAEESGVSQDTVRSQVKAILKKLGVNSQVAAVAAYDIVLNDSTKGGGAPR